MKNYLLAVVIGIMAFNFNACKDDTDIIKNTHRIKQLIYSYDNEDKTKSVFYYDGENIKTILEYYKDEADNWVECCKYGFTYSGNNVTKIYYAKHGDVWEELDKIEYVVQNGLITEETYYYIDYVPGGDYIKSWSCNYQYSGSSLINRINYSYKIGTGEVCWEDKGEYVYDNGNITKIEEYYKDSSDNWKKYNKELFTNSGGNISGYNKSILTTDNEWFENKRYKYKYSGNNVTRIDVEYWSYFFETWKEFWIEYSYNSNGFLSERNYSDNKKFVYEYEEGNGNARLFYYYPEDLVYGKPTLKNANLNKDNELPYYKRMMGIY